MQPIKTSGQDPGVLELARSFGPSGIFGVFVTSDCQMQAKRAPVQLKVTGGQRRKATGLGGDSIDCTNGAIQAAEAVFTLIKKLG